MSQRKAAGLPKPHVLWLCAGLFLPGASAWGAPQVPTGFVVENAAPGASFDTPTGIAFLPDGRLLVCQKEGTLFVVQNGSKIGPIVDIKNVVLNQGDRGLLDVAVDPDFDTNRRIYLLYTVDPDSNTVDTNDDAYGKLVSYQMTTTSSNTVDLASRRVLFGRTWTEGPTSTSVTHTIGSVRWGADKSLLVSVGEGAHFENVDDGGDDAPAFLPGRTNPIEDIGAFRAQFLGSLAGKILRLDPATGNGYESNPFFDGDVASIQSRVYAYGLRNPFRFCVRPGTGNTDPAQGLPGTIYLGDVGWSTWEELSIATLPGRNFGWPCREGLHPTTYDGGSNPSHSGCNSVGTPTNPSPFTPPVSDWHHSNPANSQPSGVIGNAASGSVFYTGTTYPVAYRGNYLFADYGQSWIRLAQVDANDNVVTFQTFGTSMDMPVDLVADPASKDIFYVSISTGLVRRIRYVGAPNNPPVAMASANPTAGTAPLTVNFSSAGSSDPDFDPLTYAWDYGDGSGSFEQNPTHVYTTSGVFLAELTVSDGHGGNDTHIVQITVGDPGTFPSTAVLDDFNRPNGGVGPNWSAASGVAIDANRLRATTSNTEPVWDANSFGLDQEAYFTFATAPNGEYHINMRLQYADPGAYHIEVKYNGQVTIATSPGWIPLGPPIAVTYAAGDQFGVRTYGPNIHVYKNGTLVGTRSFSGWIHANDPGYIGIGMINAGSASRLDNFGGGNYLPVINTPPTAIIDSPLDNAFYVENQAVSLTGNASDAQQSASQMSYHWDVTLHHNNHSHPGLLVSDNRNDVFMPENHEDGTGTWTEVKLIVTDGGGLKDTASVNIWPEVDLDPGPVTVSPDPARSIDVNTFSFMMRNYGRMLSRRSHWQLLAGTTSLAEGDTLVGPLDSLLISVPVDVYLSPGSYPLRVVADTGDVVHELSEANNDKMRALSVETGPVAVGDEPRVLAMSAPVPNPTSGRTRFWLTLPRSSRVKLTVHDVQGREVWSSMPRDLAPGRWSLEWDAGSTRAGVYLLRVEAGQAQWVRRIAVVR